MLDYIGFETVVQHDCVPCSTVTSLTFFVFIQTWNRGTGPGPGFRLYIRNGGTLQREGCLCLC